MKVEVREWPVPDVIQSDSEPVYALDAAEMPGCRYYALQTAVCAEKPRWGASSGPAKLVRIPLFAYKPASAQPAVLLATGVELGVAALSNFMRSKAGHNEYPQMRVLSADQLAAAVLVLVVAQMPQADLYFAGFALRVPLEEQHGR